MAINKLGRSETAGGWNRCGVGEHRLEINSSEGWDCPAASHAHTHTLAHTHSLILATKSDQRPFSL